MNKADKQKAIALIIELQKQAGQRGTWARALNEDMQSDVREQVYSALQRARQLEQEAADQLVALIDAS